MYKRAYVLMSERGFIEVRGRNSPPTGIEGVFFAIALCEKVHVYGFNLVAESNVPYHYHNKIKGVEAAHSFTFQAIFLKMISDGGNFDICVHGMNAPQLCNMGLS